jgi:hypothetical protein
MSMIRLNRNPTASQLNVFAAAWTVFGAGLAWFQWRAGHPTVAQACAGLAGVAPVFAVIWRPGLRGLFLGLSLATYPIGFVVSTLVLAGLYFGILTPIGWALRVFRHDPMQRTPAARADSYWRRRETTPDAARYFRQY